MSADLSASTLFNVNGLVAVITGGGTGPLNLHLSSLLQQTNPPTQESASN
jgi:hypothetical protein